MRRTAGGDRSEAVENYFNYFTEIEERFRKCRGTPTLLSALDWALIESWKESGIPLDAVLLGIQRSFEKFRAKPRRSQKINGLAYCAQAVLQAVDQLAGQKAGDNHGGTGSTGKESPPPFSEQEVVAFFERNAAALQKASESSELSSNETLARDLAEEARELRGIAQQVNAQALEELEDLELQLTALEEKVTASLTRAASVEWLAEIRREVERGLAPYRRNMTAPQIESLERQMLKKRMFEHWGVPRLSLFYL